MPNLIVLATSIRKLAARLKASEAGVAVIEFAYTAPFLFLLLGGGVELANYSVIHMRVSQIAVSLADNASRAKQGVISGVPRIREVDINEAFHAASLQAGGLDLEANGRLILSSVEVNAQGGQWIHWQRCFGGAAFSSSYGAQGAGATGTAISGIGPADRQVAAESGYAIMFVEVVYNYRPIMIESIIGHQPLRKTAAMLVRDQRDLAAGAANPAPAAPVHTCA